MNLPAHIITCSSPSMNLPTHGTTYPDLSLTSQHDNKSKKSSWLRVIAWCCLSAARQKSYADRIAGHTRRQAPGYKQTHCHRVYRLAICISLLDVACSREVPSDSITWQTRRLPGATPVAQFCWFWHPKWIVLQSRLLPKANIHTHVSEPESNYHTTLVSITYNSYAQFHIFKTCDSPNTLSLHHDLVKLMKIIHYPSSHHQTHASDTIQ